tara:strand:+ start:521 stop:862 length:342 start_codon:yes stop_codon:yes gene_type:complete
MGWQIHTVVNEGNITAEHESKLNELGDKEGFYFESTGGFPMDPDAMEHADYLGHAWFVDFIKENPDIKGTVIWNSNEGDNSGEHWGYEISEGVVTFINKYDCLRILLEREQNA